MVNIFFDLEKTSCVLQDQEEMGKKFTETVNLEELCRLRDQIDAVYFNLKGELSIDNLHQAKTILREILYEPVFSIDFSNND